MKNGSSCYPLMACIVAGRALRMEQGTSQLWELLLLARSTTGPNRFTCAECFAVLEHDADLLALGVPIDKLRSSIHHHLSLCSGCESEFNQWLGRLEDGEDFKP